MLNKLIAAFFAAPTSPIKWLLFPAPYAANIIANIA